MLSETFHREAETEYLGRRVVLAPVLHQVEACLQSCTAPEADILRWYYGTMPLSDAGAYPPELLLQFARHALRLRGEVAWCIALPEAVFLRDVAYYRINSEKIEPYGPLFFEQLYPLVEGKGVREAVLEINYWCAGHAAYTSADSRTASPLTVYRAGRGRCGEESTFLTAALRSVGIAARQVYTPRWAHCDDNHAWVEAYVDDAWHFLGACEPEEVMDRGWFSSAASRALLIHARAFAGDLAQGAGVPIGREGVTCFYNATPLYADTKELSFTVRGTDGSPVEGAEISLEILNMAEFSRIARLVTDAQGAACICIGKGDVLACVRAGTLYAEVLCPACAEKKAQQIDVTLAETQETFLRRQDGWSAAEFSAPPSAPRRFAVPTQEQQQTRVTRLAAAAAQRKAWIASEFDAQKAAGFPQAESLLRRAAGNFDEIWTFLHKDNAPQRLTLLQVMAEKDLLDATAEVLETHLQAALKLTGKLRIGKNAADSAPIFGAVQDDIFASCMLNPRIFYEELTDYRGFLNEHFTLAQKDAFLQEPSAIWHYIETEIHYQPELDYKTIYATPRAALVTGQANDASREILFVAICRALGIPARVNPVTEQAEFYEDGCFYAAHTNTPPDSSATLRLHIGQDDAELDYYKTWTIGCLRGGRFETLHYTDSAWNTTAPLELRLEPGVYRLILTVRMPNGAQYARMWTGTVADGQTTDLTLELPEGSLGDFLMQNALEEFRVTPQGQSGEAVSLVALMGAEDRFIALLEEGAEPTEHVLNEMLEQQAVLRRDGIAPLLIVRGEQSLRNETLAAVLRALPQCTVCFADLDRVAEPLARQMFVDPEKLPLLLVASEGFTGRYACSGYHVGSVNLALKILRSLAKTGQAAARSADEAEGHGDAP